MIKDKETIENYYRALVAKDVSFLNTYFAAVKTTGIYCLSSCYARKPKFENVDFYNSITEVEEAGFRACKLCKPSQE